MNLFRPSPGDGFFGVAAHWFGMAFIVLVVLDLFYLAMYSMLLFFAAILLMMMFD